MKNLVKTMAAAGVAAAALMAPATAAAQTSTPWSVSFDLGSQIALSGNAHGGASGTVLGLPTRVEAKSYGDVYGQGFIWAASLGYALGERGELRVRGGYTSNPAEELQVGTVANLPLLAQFEDYKTFNMDVGYRQYFSGTDARLRPFVGGHVGFVNADRIRATLRVPAAGVTLPDVPFYDSSTVPAFGGTAGFLMGLTNNLAFQAGAEFTWHGDLAQEEGLSGTGLTSINDESRRWTMPVTAGLTLRF